MHNTEFLSSKVFLPTKSFSKKLSKKNWLSLILLGENALLVHKKCVVTEYTVRYVWHVIFISRFAKINIVSKSSIRISCPSLMLLSCKLKITSERVECFQPKLNFCPWLFCLFKVFSFLSLNRNAFPPPAVLYFQQDLFSSQSFPTVICIVLLRGRNNQKFMLPFSVTIFLAKSNFCSNALGG